MSGHLSLVVDTDWLVPHEICTWFPLFDAEALAELAADIREHGQHEPIVYAGEVLLDGRNRLAACRLAEVPPRLVEYTGDPAGIPDWIISRNLHRRHLTTSQRAMLAARIATRPVGRSETGRNAGVPTQAEAAERVGISERSVRNGRAVLDHGDPVLIAQVEAGEVAVTAAASRTREQRIAAARSELGDLRPSPAELGQVLADQRPRDVRAAVRTPRRVNDAYYTPSQLAEACLARAREGKYAPIELRPTTRVLEPHVGGGAWAALVAGQVHLTTCDIDPEASGLALGDEQIVGDFLTHDFFAAGPFDLILGNPPFNDAEAHVRRAQALLADHGRLLFLLRRNFVGPARFGLLEDGLGPVREWVIGPRVSFTGDAGVGETDMQEYSLFEFVPPALRRQLAEGWRTTFLRWR